MVGVGSQRHEKRQNDTFSHHRVFRYTVALIFQADYLLGSDTVESDTDLPLWVEYTTFVIGLSE
jgi:ABC-type methionine transport system ATPase subunit